MRLTVRLDPEIYAAAKSLAAEREIGIGEAVNELAHRGLTVGDKRKRYKHMSDDMGMLIECTNIGEVLEYLEHEDELDDEEHKGVAV